MARSSQKNSITDVLLKELEGIRSDLAVLKLEQRTLRGRIDTLLAKQLRKKITRARK